MTVHSDIANKVVLVTGANTGIGRVTAHELADAGAHVFLACRSADRTLPVIEAIKERTGNPNVEMLTLDLGNLDSVEACAESFLKRDLPLDILINNAGLAGGQGMTESGFELHFGVNHIGHALFTHRLLESLKRPETARIVHVASRAHTRVKEIDWAAMQETTATKTGFPEYCVSKLANVAYNMALAKRLEGTGVRTYALHPGVVASDVWRRVPWPFQSVMKWFMITNEEGAQTTLYCATSPDVADHQGLYYDESKLKTVAPHATDELAEELWSRTMDWLKLDQAT